MLIMLCMLALMKYYYNNLLVVPNAQTKRQSMPAIAIQEFQIKPHVRQNQCLVNRIYTLYTESSHLDLIQRLA